MTRTAIVHAGLPKTGTSTIQKALFENRARLLSDFGFIYPGTVPNHSEPLSAIFGPMPAVMIQMMQMGRPGQSSEEVQRDALQLLESHLAAPGWDTLLLSAEDLSNFTRRELAPLRDWLAGYVDRVRVMFWARQPVAFTVSNIQQMVRGGYLIQDMVAKSDMAAPCLAGRLNQHATVFGEDAIEVRTLEAAAEEPGGIVAAFCRKIGLPEAVAMELAGSAPAAENPSISQRAAYAINELNSIRPLFVGGQVNPSRTLEDANMIVDMLPGAKFDLPKLAKEQIREEVRRDFSEVNARFGLDLYPEIFASMPLEGQEPPADLVVLRNLALNVADANVKLRGGGR